MHSVIGGKIHEFHAIQPKLCGIPIASDQINTILDKFYEKITPPLESLTYNGKQKIKAGATMSDEEKSDSEKEARKQERESRVHDEGNKHGLMLKGKADGLIIKTNAAEGENFSDPDDPKAKKKKDRDAYDRILLDLINDIEEGLKEVRSQIKATNKLKEFMKRNELDYDNPEHILLIHQAGLTEDYVKENGMQGLNDHFEELRAKEHEYRQKRADAKDLQDQFSENPEDPKVLQEIEDMQETRIERFKTAVATSVAKDILSEEAFDTGSIKMKFNDASIGEEAFSSDPIAKVTPAIAPVI
ncbi:hypothetical protein QQ020_26060 [Fulvivirgaceae bacterium BMA12]|uniref:Uncharacterized protein n=1 Tax=Agaribacillus aureus TaxID=3051825 RepID=A0ABT8LCT4_9BACT|nr:hypothetical protein [Fulvivirgaceae bacterium BMA12]